MSANADVVIPADGEKVAVTWFLRNACASNVQLGIVSNVCRRWRDVAVDITVSEAVVAASSSASAPERSWSEGEDGEGDDGVGRRRRTESSSPEDGEVGATANDDAINPSSSRRRRRHRRNAPSSIRGLLITDMARELVMRRRARCEQRNGSDDAHATTTTTSTTTTDASPKISRDGDHDDDGADEGRSFCLAWFAPSGIRTASVSLDDDEKEDDDDDEIDEGGEGFQFDLCGNDNNNGGAIEDDGIATRGRSETGRRRKVERKKNVVTCCSEWRGYRHATEVLAPFGYSTRFVTSVLDKSSELAIRGDGAAERETGSTESPSPKQRPKAKRSREYDPTYSVRGATLARPEGFCLCVDDDDDDGGGAEQRRANSSGLPPNETLGLSSAQRERKRADLARALLPRVVLSTRRKYPLLHRFAEADAEAKGNFAAAAPQSRSPLPWERRQRAVQFLNSDRSQAVKLITPRFGCGPARGPVTVFVVAITTEDGCFLSGRFERFELGHLYPLGARDMQHDTSPICIATGTNDGDGGRGGGQEDRAARDRRSTAADSDSDRGDSTDDSDRSARCLCKFESGDPFNPQDLDVEDPAEDCIHRGCTGPGLWHCYAAVFDGEDSKIRVDGCEEPKRTREHYGLATSDDEEEEDADNPANSGRLVGSGVLDGLSIGSDHQFDMSLCYGEIDGECGQGAIAELAVFKGRMDDADVERIEKHMMEKHGILSVQEKREFVAKQNAARAKPLHVECHLQEDEWRRQAHALIEQRRPWNLEGRVPLRAAANHPSVAWHRTNEITGAPVRITRIGARNSNGSSDW